MLDQKRVDAERRRLFRSMNPDEARQVAKNALQDVEQYLRGDAPNAISAGFAFDAISFDDRFAIFAAADTAGRGIAASYLLSLRLIHGDIVRKRRGTGLKVGNQYSMSNTLGMSVPMSQAAGWIATAADFARDIWTDYRAEKEKHANVLFGNPNPGAWVNVNANPYMTHKAAWFTTMTTVAPDLWQPYGYDPDPDSLGPFWMLAQVWQDPDPAKVRNALQAVRDLNIGTTFIKDNPMGKRVYIVDEFLLLDDYDIRSVNMRRIALGLAPVQVDSYLPDPLPNEVLPFAQDDIFWPAYLKMCDEIGATPIAPDNVVEVRLDPETLRVENR